MAKFTHLHVHSQYSILDGMASISQLIEKSVSLGMYNLALTDHGNMFGIKEFAQEAEKYNKNISEKIKENEEKIVKLQEQIAALEPEAEERKNAEDFDEAAYHKASEEQLVEIFSVMKHFACKFFRLMTFAAKSLFTNSSRWIIVISTPSFCFCRKISHILRLILI